VEAIHELPFRRSRTAAKASSSFAASARSVYQARDQAPLKTILVSSGMPAEGKTFVAANLAMSLARNRIITFCSSTPTCAVPSLHTILGAPNAPGLSEYLAGNAELNDILQRNRIPALLNPAVVRRHLRISRSFLPASAATTLLELVANHRIEELIATLSPHFDWILIDSPPVLAVADAIDIARAADAVLLVARGATTPLMLRSARRPPSATRASWALC
jgi:protein-tyrosine kinase